MISLQRYKNKVHTSKMAHDEHHAVLSLDLGTSTGWAVLKEDGSILSGSINFRPRRFEGGGMRYLRFGRWLDEILQMCPEVHEVYFEEVRRHLGVDASHAYGGFLACLSAWCEKNEIPYEGIPVGSIKKYIAGKGNASKQEVIKAVQDRNHDPKDDNEADAIALLYLVIDKMVQSTKKSTRQRT